MGKHPFGRGFVFSSVINKMNCNWNPEDDTQFPPDFPDVGGKTFLWVKKHRPVFCDFVRDDMYNTSGLFKVFQDYLRLSS